MRAVIQRVKNASVTIAGKLHAQIGSGLLILIGITQEDGPEDIAWLSTKISNLRIFDDPHGLMNLSVNELLGEVLVVSQFTLFASTKKGNRPSYIGAAHPDVSLPLYEEFLTNLEKKLKKPVKSGKFGAMMEVSLLNDGPVTIIMDTKNKE